MNTDKSTTHRRKSRELLLQALFQLEFTRSNLLVESLKRLETIFNVEPSVLKFAQDLAEAYDNNKEPIESQLTTLSQNWSVDRMATVDKNIIRMALLEINFIEDIPPNVSINEAIEIAKIYGSTESASFVNGILDQALKGL